jgi:putative redox protein
MSEGFQVIVSSHSGLSQEIVSSAHRWRADEPAPVGDGTGPSPYELLLSSLGACTSMTLRLYAQKKGIDLKTIKIRLRHYRVHVEDCRDCENKSTFLDRIDREIEFTGELDESQKQRLLEIAERCPVHKTLKSGAEIRTSMALAARSGPEALEGR